MTSSLTPVVSRSIPAAPTVPVRMIESAPAANFEQAQIPLGTIMRGGGDFEVDWARAHADAQLTLQRMNLRSSKLVLWVAGTSNRGVHPAFQDAADEALRWFELGSTSVSALVYEPTWDLRRSVGTGLATLLLVLQHLRRLGYQGEVLVAGESQGAWIIGEALAHPQLGSVITRAALLGHPWLAAHQYPQSTARVRVTNHVGDQVALPVKGDLAKALDAMVGVRLLQLGKLDDAARVLAQNPEHAVALLRSAILALPGARALIRDPHNYSAEMTRVVEWLIR